MYQEHPIPQQISSYQFRLVGDMTLTQFFQVAGGTVAAIILYSLNIPPYIKWPLMIVSFLIGVAFAFFPIEDRPLQKWVILFFKSIYSPTLYEWQKNYQKPYYFQDDIPSTTVSIQQTQIPVELNQEEIMNTKVYLDSKGTKKTEQNINPLEVSLENKEKILLSKISRHLETNKDLASESLKYQNYKNTHAENVLIPQTQSIHVFSQKENNMPTTVNPINQIDRVTTEISLKPISETVINNTIKAQFSQDATPPLTSTQPNIIVGQILTKDGKIIENAIIEIRDEKGMPVRALKSNQLGHFAIVTPLANGSYQLIVEKEGYIFDVISIDLVGDIVPPIIVVPN